MELRRKNKKKKNGVYDQKKNCVLRLRRVWRIRKNKMLLKIKKSKKLKLLLVE